MVNHPDAGETNMTYDAAGNLLTKLTAELRKSISDKGYISYTYDFERLHEVLYPENLFNRVTYTYGKAGDKYNRAGRLALVEDASGGEAYYYGRQGEVTKTVRTVMASVADIRTYVYGATYDSWNRVQTMTYPDGEVVTYHYNAAGQIDGLSSNKGGQQSVIVDKIGYDKDGHTVYTKLGNGSYVTAGQQDYAERMNQIQKQKEAYYKQQGIAPGVPAMKGAYGDPENTKRGYNSIIDTLGNHDVPQGWVQTPRPNTTPGTNPGAPVSWNDPTNPDDLQAGYGYIPNDTTKEETFFYHSDHLGSTSYITDDHANITQYDAYLPYGELLVDEHSSSEELPYKFNGKQFDEETDLYYYGARYLNSVTSLWYGVDPLTEKYPDISSYSYYHNNPILLVDPDGAYPIITITKQKTGRTTWQRIIGYTGQERDVITRVNLYKVTVRDTEDKDFRMEFSVTRDAFTVRKGDRNGNRLVLSNVAYEPKKEEDNRYTAQVIEYPRGNGTKALKLKQHGSEVMYATSNNVSVEMGYRNKSDVAAGVMMHVGGIYNLKGEYHYAASEGCFGITNSDKSSSNDSTNKILDSIINQSRKSKTNKNRIDVIIEKRDVNKIPQTKNVVIK